MGLYFGGENVSTGRSSENVKGFWERRDVRDLNDAILAAAGGDWDVVSDLDLDGLPSESKTGYVSAAEDIVLNLDAHRPWFVKEPRLCVLFPIWRQSLETPKVIHIHRNPLEVARSLHERNGIPNATGLALWEIYNTRALQASEGLPRHFLGYEELLERPETTLASLSSFLARDGGYALRQPTAHELSSFLDPALHRQHADATELSACATQSQLALYEFLKEPLAHGAPDAPSTECLEILRQHEATVDLSERQQRAADNRDRRTADNLEIQLAIRDVQLRQAVTMKDDAVTRGDALTRKVDKLQDMRRDLTSHLAVANDRVATLRKQGQRLEGQVDHLREAGERLARERDRMQRDILSLRSEREQARRLHDELNRANAEIRRESDESRRKVAVLRRERKEIDTQRRRLLKHRDDSARATSAMRAENVALVRQWDAELVRRQVQLVELDDFIGHLHAGIRAWLGSRRWRLGDALLTLPRRLTFRRTATPLLALLQASLDGHEANKATDREAAHSHTRLLADVPDKSSVAATAGNQAVLGESTRSSALNQMLLDRAAALSRSAAEIAERRRFAEELIRLAETLHNSRRWRLGHLLLSLPRRILGRPRPATAADALSALIREYRRDAGPAPAATELKHPSRAIPGPASERVATTAPPTQRAIQTASAPLFPCPVSGEVDVVVCVHNALAHVEQCLQSVLTRTTVPYRLIIVNDGSDAPTTNRLREIDSMQDVVTLIETDGPLGYTCAANRGLRASTAANVVLLNSDTIVPRLWLEDMLECMASGSRVGVVGPLSNAASWQSVPERTTADGRWAVNELPAGYNVDEYAELVWLSSKRRFPRVDFVNGFCFMIKRSVIEQVGLLDEDSFPRGYGEENDYCIRAQDAGFELAIADNCFVYHAKSKSFGDATRDKLAQEGGVALERKHGKARIDRSSEGLRDSAVLAEIRETVRSRIGKPSHFDGSKPSEDRAIGNHVLFVLPVRGGSGGANSVVQEAVGMRALGVDAKVATHVKYVDDFQRFYPEYLEAGDHFVFYESDDDLMRRAAPFQVIIATLWSTPGLIAPIATRWPDKLYVYYVQDYEPWFFADDVQSRTIALDSYTLIPDMVLMAKTDWICRTVEDRHGKPVYRVAPSLDHSVFYAGKPRPEGGAVKIAAMFRPTTPRRGPLRTIRVLKDVIANCDHPVQVLLFGCETQHLNTYIDRNAPELRLTRHFDSRGVLPRQRVADLMRESDIFVDLSDYQAFGRTGLEAMACGCAVVVPKEGGVYEYAAHGKNCLIVDTRSDHEMSSAIQGLADDADLRATMAANAIETANRFDIRRASLSEMSVFRAALAARHHRPPNAALRHSRGVTPTSKPAPPATPIDAVGGVQAASSTSDRESCAGLPS